MPAHRKHWKNCVVCGGLLATQRYQNQTCRSPECRAAILLHPILKEPGRTGTPWGWNKPKTAPRERLELLMRRFGFEVPDSGHEALRLGALELRETSDWNARDWGMMEDDRGAANPESQEAVWGWLSRVTVFLRSIGQEGGQASLVVRLRNGETSHMAVERSLSQTARVLARGCDYFLAWRCPCEHDHRVEYTSIEALPKGLGYHDACPLCGAAPLEVIHE